MSDFDAVRVAVSLAEAGVTFANKGARCPLCGWKMRTVSSHMHKSIRIRRHRCGNPVCLMAVMDQTVKSVEGCGSEPFEGGLTPCAADTMLQTEGANESAKLIHPPGQVPPTS